MRVSAANRRLQDAVALDGYREGANRIDTPSLENKGESTQDIERMMTPPLAQGNSQSLVEGERRTLPKASYSKWQGTVIPGVPETMREWIVSYLDELPNFVCDYKESTSEMFRGNWIRMDSNEGQVRHVDGKSDFLVATESGIPTNKKIWEVSSGSPDSFASISAFLSPSTNYRFTPNGEGVFTFQSDAGVYLVTGYTKDGRPKGVKDYPTWGTVRVDKSSHAILEFVEYFRVPERGMLASLFVSGFVPGEHSWLREFGYVDVGEQSYWLPKREELTVIYSDPNHDPRRVVQTYDNCRRFEVDSTISYGPEVATVQPDTGQAPGGTGGESPTAPPAPETGWEDGADPDSARVADRSPTIPPQPPRAAPQPPLSAVLTSPKRNAPFEGTPTDYVGGGGGGSENRPLKRYGYHSTHQPPPDSFIPSRYGYYGSEPSLDSPATLTGDLLSRYGYHPVEYTPLEPKEEEEAAARSASWWFVLMVGIVAFSGGFFGNFLRGKAE